MAQRASAASHPARPTSVKKRPKGAFLLCAVCNDSKLQQVRVERSETTAPPAATARRVSAASHPARPTNVKKRPKGAFLLCAVCNDSKLQQVRVEHSETTSPPAAMAQRASAASHPARPTNVKSALKALFYYAQFVTIRSCSRFGSNTVRQHRRLRRWPKGRAQRVILHDPPM